MFIMDKPTEAELRAGDLAALELLFELIKWSLIAAGIAAAILLYRSSKQFGAPKPSKAMWIWFSAAMSFVAVFMPLSIILVFGVVLSHSLPGLSILAGLIGIESIGVLRVLKIWEKRSEQMT